MKVSKEISLADFNTLNNSLIKDTKLINNFEGKRFAIFN